MTKVFEFRDYSLDLSIAGKQFRVNCNSDIGETMQSLSDSARALAEQIGAGQKTDKDALLFLTGAIDRVLGAGASEKIFEGRKMTVTDASDVLTFLSNEISAMYRQTKAAPVNRAQRRAAAKAK